MTRPDDHPDHVYRARVAQCDRLLGAVYHDLGNVLLPGRGDDDPDDVSDAARSLRSLRRQTAALVEHLLAVRAAADALRADGREEGPSLPAEEWWGATARFCRSMFRRQPSLRLAVEGGDDDTPVDPRRLGRPLMLALIAIDERYDLETPVWLRLDASGRAARFQTDQARPPARSEWPAALDDDLRALGARIIARDDTQDGHDLLHIALPPGSISPKRH